MRLCRLVEMTIDPDWHCSHSRTSERDRQETALLPRGESSFFTPCLRRSGMFNRDAMNISNLQPYFSTARRSLPTFSNIFQQRLLFKHATCWSSIFFSSRRWPLLSPTGVRLCKIKMVAEIIQTLSKYQMQTNSCDYE